MMPSKMLLLSENLDICVVELFGSLDQETNNLLQCPHLIGMCNHPPQCPTTSTFCRGIEVK